ncbi:MAG: hypothetical protein PHG02_04990 [Oscillospiraceae bacterium]|nr:hypothetical protein [Oscillospiraceae bacterium]
MFPIVAVRHAKISEGYRFQEKRLRYNSAKCAAKSVFKYPIGKEKHLNSIGLIIWRFFKSQTNVFRRNIKSRTL